MHPTYIADIENGKANAPIYSYFQIAKALDLPLSELVTFASAKQTIKQDAALTEPVSRVRGLDRKKQVLFISAARGLMSGMEQK